MELNFSLKQNQVFTHLGEAELEDLAANSITRSYGKGEWITHYGDLWPYLFFVEKGEIEAVKESHDGKSLIVMQRKAGEVFWGVGFFLDDGKMPVALVAKEDCRIILWHRDRILPLLHANGHLSWELSRLMAELMRNVSEIVDDLAFQPVTSRLARLLLSHFGSSGEGYISRDMTLDEMASRIGTTREVVCRQLYRFADEGLIQINRTELMIADRNRLEEQANQASRE
jgi:CRP/FNR family transcriptional regulator